MEQLLVENSEEGTAFIELIRTNATSFTDSRCAAAVSMTFTKKSSEYGIDEIYTHNIVIRKNEWIELKRLVNEILKGK